MKSVKQEDIAKDQNLSVDEVICKNCISYDHESCESWKMKCKSDNYCCLFKKGTNG